MIKFKNTKYLKSQNIRIDKYLYNYFKKKISRQQIQKDIHNGLILVNKKKIQKNYILKKNDNITVFFYKKNKSSSNYIYTNKNLDINIHYENGNIIVINKKPGQIVHPGHGNYKNTIVNWLKYYYKTNNYDDKLSNNYYRYGLLHRLDKETSGLLIIAKNKKTFNNIKNQFINRKIKKKYLAFIWGIPLEKKNIISNYIGRNKKNRIKMTVYHNNKYGKYSVTKYKVLKTFKIISLVECDLKTGRTHQIRVHFKNMGHPIFNDKLYGGDKNRGLLRNYKYKTKYTKLFQILPRQALHAYSITFKDPIYNKNITFKAKTPKDFNNFIKYLKNNF